jgi:hypothetical protein
MAGPKLDITMFETIARQNDLLNWYAIADSAQHAALPTSITTHNLQRQCLFDALPGSPIANYAPHLVELPTPMEQSASWLWIARNATATPCVSLIATKLSFAELYAGLAGFIEVLLPDGEPMFFAFWDPAILGTLMGQVDDVTLHVKGPVLLPDQQVALLQGITTWWYLDRAGSLHALTGQTSFNTLPSLPITLTQHQVDDLVEASVPDHILYNLELNQPLLIADVPQAQRYKVVRDALSQARVIGVLSMRDLTNFVCARLIYGPNFYTNTTIQNLLGEVRKQQISLDDALKQIQ